MHTLFTQMPILFIGFSFALALLIGSFLNVVIYRLPIMMEREWRAQCEEKAATAATELPTGRFDLLAPRSCCPACGHQITAMQNIPGHQLPDVRRQVQQLPGADIAALSDHRAADGRTDRLRGLAFRLRLGGRGSHPDDLDAYRD